MQRVGHRLSSAFSEMLSLRAARNNADNVKMTSSTADGPPAAGRDLRRDRRPRGRSRGSFPPRSPPVHGLLPEGVHRHPLSDLRSDPGGRVSRAGRPAGRVRHEPARHGRALRARSVGAGRPRAPDPRKGPRSLGLSPGRGGAPGCRRGRGSRELGLPDRRRPLTAVGGRRLYSSS